MDNITTLPCHYVLRNSIGITAGSIFFWGLIGLAWGLFCGSFASTVLAAIGWAAGLQTGIAGTLYVAVLGRRLIRPLVEGDVFRQLAPLAAFSAAAALVGSWRIYCRYDLFRLTSLRQARFDDGTRTDGELAWLACGEIAPFALGMSVIGALATLTRILGGTEAVQPIGIGAAVLCGLATFTSELPPRHRNELSGWCENLHVYWIVKEVLRWVATVLFTALAASGVATLALTASFGGPDISAVRRLGPPDTNFNEFVEFLIYAMMYGYVIGRIYSVCYRKWTAHASPDPSHN
jgi:hypothetical protein